MTAIAARRADDRGQTNVTTREIDLYETADGLELPGVSLLASGRRT